MDTLTYYMALFHNPPLSILPSIPSPLETKLTSPTTSGRSSYLGQPILLAHTISSPEFSLKETDKLLSYSSEPLVTLHNVPLVSPGSSLTNSAPINDLQQQPTRILPKIPSPDRLLRSPTNQSGRSYSELVLPSIEISGESNETHHPDISNEPRSRSNFTCLRENVVELPKLFAEPSSFVPTLTNVNSAAAAGRHLIDCQREINVESDKRSRSLSPCYPVPRCLCYNCNVSELILQSLDLPAPERSNFKSYFVRSLSHKFFNCSCYSVCQCDDDRPVSPTSFKGKPYSLCRCGRCCYPLVKRCPLTEAHHLLPRKNQYPAERKLCGRLLSGNEIAARGLCRTASCPNFELAWSWDCLRRRRREERNESPESGRNRRCRSFDDSNPKPSPSPPQCSKISFNEYHHHPGHEPHTHYILSWRKEEARQCEENPRDRTFKSFHRSPIPKIQPQRSFSSPDTRPTIIQPDPTCTARRHRHGISGQMSYFKLLGYNVSKKLTGSANSLFSTAVISGSSSAPNLKDMVPPHASAVAAIEGFGGVPPIRPLETLHNALSLRQLDSFLEMMTSIPLFRTPASSPPKQPSPAGSAHEITAQNINMGAISRDYHSSHIDAVRCNLPTPIHYKPPSDMESADIRNQASPTSPNSTGWSSEPQSFLSSEPSSPAPTSTGECSMSISLISNDGNASFSASHKISSTTPCLDLDFNEFCMNMDHDHRESRGSVSYTDYYSNEDGQIRRSGLEKIAAKEEASSSSPPALAPDDSHEEENEHTLTLRQAAEEQKKQDIKLIFEPKDITNPARGNYKRIGRFRVESMEVPDDDDVRIKEKAAAATSSAIQQGSKRKNIFRSQSASTPHAVLPKLDVSYSYKSPVKQSSFSNMSDRDLEEWKSTVTDSKAFAPTPSNAQQDQPILTLASSLKDNSTITIGFNVQNEQQK